MVGEEKLKELLNRALLLGAYYVASGLSLNETAKSLGIPQTSLRNSLAYLSDSDFGYSTLLPDVDIEFIRDLAEQVKAKSFRMRNNIDPAVIEKAGTLYLQPGISVAVIAEQIGISTSTAHKYIKLYKSGASKQDADKIEEKAAGNGSAREIEYKKRVLEAAIRDRLGLPTAEIAADLDKSSRTIERYKTDFSRLFPELANVIGDPVLSVLPVTETAALLSSGGNKGK